MKYDPVENRFVNFEAVETPVVEINLPLLDTPLDISSWSSKVSDSGTPIVQNNLQSRMTNNNPSQGDVIEPSQEEISTPTPTQERPLTSQQRKFNFNVTGKGSDQLSRLIDEVSQESGYEGLRNVDIKNLLMLQAKRESGFNHKAKSSSSTASGYFQFIDSTRRRFSSMDKASFLNDPKEQIRAAYKLLNEIHNQPNAKRLLGKGYNMAQVTALGWWYPDSMRMVLNGERNFSKGGYSIKKALSDYQS